MPATARPESQQAFVTYDIDADEWTELPMPPNEGDDYCCAIAAAGNQIVAYPGSDELGETADHIFDPASQEWTELPADPLSPTFDRVMVWSGTELIHFALGLLDLRESAEPGLSMVAALNVETGDWRRLPDTGSLGVGGTLVDGRIVNPTLGGADGGETNNWGREYPTAAFSTRTPESGRSYPTRQTARMTSVRGCSPALSRTT